MLSLPQLLEEDILVLDAALDELVLKSEALSALLIDKGGPLITSRGSCRDFDFTTVAALAAGSFAANEAIASLVGERNFSSVYQQGENHSILVENVDGQLLLLIIFKAAQSVGVVKYYTASTINTVAGQLQKAMARSPGSSIDLVSMNLLDTSELFRRKPGADAN